MRYLQKSPFDCSVEELDKELLIRGAQVPEKIRFRNKGGQGLPEYDFIMAQVRQLYEASTSLSSNDALRHISTEDLVKVISYKTGTIEVSGARGSWGADDRKDFFDIEDDSVLKNAQSVAAICHADNLKNKGNGNSTLNVMNYGNIFNLCSNSPFYNQPIVKGDIASGFLVDDDIIATAGHVVDKLDPNDLRIFFGFTMSAENEPVVDFPDENIYKGVNIIRKPYDVLGSGADWALIKLDRKVTNRPVVRLSENEVDLDQPVYVIGHPVGLPLKCSLGMYITETEKDHFAADLDIYSGHSGSPVFDEETNEVVGIVVRAACSDLRWTGNCWYPVIYSQPDWNFHQTHCAKATEFAKHL